jgi:hypothetical protein
VLLILAAAAFGATPSPDEQYLDGLVGGWDMKGKVGSEPVRYQAKGERVLQNGFLRLHMIDASRPPQYEASLYVGYDPKTGDFVAHWLDRYGAAGARVVATGRRDGDVLVLVFPYAQGSFRDTFTRKKKAWTLLIESQAPDGSWTTFASYELARK